MDEAVLQRSDLGRLIIGYFLLWCVLLAICWPLALLFLMLAPLIWLIALPFRLLGMGVAATFALIKALLFLPARLLGGSRVLV